MMAVAVDTHQDKVMPSIDEPQNIANSSVNGTSEAVQDVQTELPLANATTELQHFQNEETFSGIRKTPFSHPGPKSHIPSPKSLTPEQTAKYNTVLKTVSSWITVPTTSAPKSPTAPITPSERIWLTRECILRYLRATKWSTTDATKRLLATLTWRREYGIDTFTPDFISPENETGKQIICGYDVAGRPCLYLNPARQNTKTSPRQINHLVYMLERTIDIMPPGQETLTLLISFEMSGDGPKLGQGKQVMGILQGHYPERLGRAVVTNIPWIMNGFFKLITPFIDPITREKLKFNEEMRLHVPPEQLLKMRGGDVDFEYEHAVYWPALNKLAEERRKEQEARWTRGGKRVGELEAYLRGGQEEGIRDLELKNEEKVQADALAEKLAALETTEEGMVAA